jgi:hypothetical protein
MLTTRLPASELTRVLTTISGAVRLAHSGEIADGYTELLLALHQARAMGADDQPWANEVIRRYEEALERYAAIFGVARA